MSVQPPSIQDFRTRFPAFSNDQVFPDESLNMYLEEAVLELSPCMLGGYYRKAIMLHMAHFITIEHSANSKAGDTGENLETIFNAQGAISIANVGDVSVSKNLGVIKNDNPWGNFKATMFGQELIRILQKMGRGGFIARERISDDTCSPLKQGVVT